MLATAFVLLVFVKLAKTEALCPLCGNVTEIPEWWNFNIDDGRTCKDVYVELVNVPESSTACKAEQREHGDFCCGDTKPSRGGSGDGQPYNYTGPHGNEPECPICRRKDLFPGDPTKAISARFVGTFSCAHWYYRGLNRMIPRDMCLALQGYIWTECVCDKGIPPPGSGSGSSTMEPTNLLETRKTRCPTNKQRLRTGRGGAADRND